ncbi:MAG: class I SAM-dependent methyltransferase [Steroidobacteraceae bacterium]
MKTVGVDPQLQRNYDEYYGEDISEWREMGAVDKVANIRSLCAAHAPSTVLDIGAGEGSVLQQLGAGGFGQRHFALDISASGVERIRNRQIPTLVECRQFDGYTVPYPDETFDLAILSHVLEHVEHPRLLLNEAARVADYVFVEVPLEHNRGLPADFVWDAVGHINFYTAKTIRLLVQSCGHEVLEQRETHPARRQYLYRLGRKGVVAYLLKEVALRTMPSLAQSLWTYHSSLLVRSRRPAAANEARLPQHEADKPSV